MNEKGGGHSHCDFRLFFIMCMVVNYSLFVLLVDKQGFYVDATCYKEIQAIRQVLLARPNLNQDYSMAKQAHSRNQAEDLSL